MSKYSYEFKKKVVNAYLNGEGGYKYLAEQYGVPSHSKVKLWVDNYKSFGDDGLKRSRQQVKYSFEKKLFVVELYLSSEISYQDLALQEGITNPSMIVDWVIFSDTGISFSYRRGRWPTRSAPRRRRPSPSPACRGRAGRAPEWLSGRKAPDRGRRTPCRRH